MPRKSTVWVCDLCGYVSINGELDVVRCEKVHVELGDMKVIAVLQDPDGNLIPGSSGMRMKYREGTPMPTLIKVAGKGGQTDTYIRLKSMEESTQVYTPFELGIEGQGGSDSKPME